MCAPDRKPGGASTPTPCPEEPVMAWIEKRTLTDATTSAQVKWRLGGRRGGPMQPETFSAGSDEQTPARAEGLKTTVKAAGQHWPEGWVRGEGFVPPPHDAP